jgi:hypothetical protein
MMSFNRKLFGEGWVFFGDTDRVDGRSRIPKWQFPCCHLHHCDPHGPNISLSSIPNWCRLIPLRLTPTHHLWAHVDCRPNDRVVAVGTEKEDQAKSRSCRRSPHLSPPCPTCTDVVQPKSANLTTLWSSKRLDGLMSRWMYPLLWRKRSPESISCVYLLKTGSVRPPGAGKKCERRGGGGGLGRRTICVQNIFHRSIRSKLQEDS